MARPPRNIKRYVRRFCEKIAAGESPLYVPVHPVPGAQAHDCFGTVPDYVTRIGGEQVIGWAIWEWPRVYIEAEFHAVWRHPTGHIVDITPKEPPIPRILFLPDPKRQYVGRQVENVLHALRSDPAIECFIDREHLIYNERNKEELAEKHGEIPVSQELLSNQMKQARLYGYLQQRFGEVTAEAFTERTTKAARLPET